MLFCFKTKLLDEELIYTCHSYTNTVERLSYIKKILINRQSHFPNFYFHLHFQWNTSLQDSSHTTYCCICQPVSSFAQNDEYILSFSKNINKHFYDDTFVKASCFKKISNSVSTQNNNNKGNNTLKYMQLNISGHFRMSPFSN